MGGHVACMRHDLLVGKCIASQTAKCEIYQYKWPEFDGVCAYISIVWWGFLSAIAATSPDHGAREFTVSQELG